MCPHVGRKDSNAMTVFQNAVLYNRYLRSSSTRGYGQWNSEFGLSSSPGCVSKLAVLLYGDTVLQYLDPSRKKY